MVPRYGFGEHHTEIRIPVSGGLIPCSAEVDAHRLEITPTGTIQFDEHHVEKAIDVAGNGHFERLFVVPPCIEVRSGEVGAPAPWRIAAPPVSLEALTEDRFVAIRAPGVELVECVFVDSHSNGIQVGAHPKTKTGSVFELRTQQFADAAKMHSAGCLVATLKTQAGTVDLTALSIEPKSLGSSVTLRDGVLVPDLDGLSAYVWCTTAP